VQCGRPSVPLRTGSRNLARCFDTSRWQPHRPHPQRLPRHFRADLWPDQQNHLHPDKAAKVEQELKQGRKRPSPRTSARTDDRLTIIAKQLRAEKVAALTAGDIQDFVNALRECGLAPRTVRMAHGAIRAALTTAVRQKKLPTTSPLMRRCPGRPSARSSSSLPRRASASSNRPRGELSPPTRGTLFHESFTSSSVVGHALMPSC
jgi:hypothetical protein